MGVHPICKVDYVLLKGLSWFNLNRDVTKLILTKVHEYHARSRHLPLFGLTQMDQKKHVKRLGVRVKCGRIMHYSKDNCMKRNVLSENRENKVMWCTYGMYTFTNPWTYVNFSEFMLLYIEGDLI